MVEFDYSAIQKIASDVLTDFNQGTIQIVKITPGAGPVEQPGAPTEAIFTAKGTARGVSKKYVDGGLAKVTDLQVTLSVSANWVPTPIDKIIINGERHNIFKIMDKPPSGVVVAYILIVRR